MNSWKKCKEEVKFWFEVVGLLGGVAVVYLLYRQNNELEDSIVISQQQMTVMQKQMLDSETQQRAWLGIESYEAHRIYSSKTIHIFEGRYAVEIKMVIKNFGSTPAADIRFTGLNESEMAEQFYKEHALSGLTNSIHKWGKDVLPGPQPGTMGISIMPMQTATNTYELGNFIEGEGFYNETWVSYRDVFGHPWIIGAGGTYDFKNDAMTIDFIRLGDYKMPAQTNNHDSQNSN